MTSEEELVAIWRTTRDHRFQNYRAHFTILNEAVVSRAWIDQILAALPTRSMTIDRSHELKATIAGRSRYTVDAAALRDWVDEVQLGIGALHTSLSSTFFTPETTRSLHPSGRVVV